MPSRTEKNNNNNNNNKKAPESETAQCNKKQELLFNDVIFVGKKRNVARCCEIRTI